MNLLLNYVLTVGFLLDWNSSNNSLLVNTISSISNDSSCISPFLYLFQISSSFIKSYCLFRYLLLKSYPLVQPINVLNQYTVKGLQEVMAHIIRILTNLPLKLMGLSIYFCITIVSSSNTPSLLVLVIFSKMSFKLSQNCYCLVASKSSVRPVLNCVILYKLAPLVCRLNLLKLNTCQPPLRKSFIKASHSLTSKSGPNSVCFS